ncbi:glycosyltransferase [Fodinibius sp. Rm-B-1B1-1]|uniref:glycosyltransferase n=1 Tax=Fodinibius alkaliphilus TaxID=3140241 RepID=UPI00315ABEED
MAPTIKQHVLIIGFVWPEPSSSAAGKRMVQLIELFQAQGWQVTFASSAAKTEHMVNLESLGVNTRSIEINSSTFDTFVADLRPSIVLFDRFVVEEQFGWRVAEQCPNAVRVLDTEDLHFLRRARKKAVNESRSCTEADLRSSKDAKREIASIYRSDLSLIISDTEQDLLENTFGVQSDLLQYLPFVLEAITPSTASNWRDYGQRKDFMTIGNFRHAPNMDAVRYLKKQMWPLIRKQLPDAQLHIYGAYVSQEAEQMHDPDSGFIIEGRAPNAADVISEAKVMLAPLRFGAGLKGKLIEAMQCGTPSITTTIGAEGIQGNLSWGGVIADEPEKFADAAVRLYNDEEVWKASQEQGALIINKRFAQVDFKRALIDQITHIQRNLDQHRRQNFTGQMLMHHTAASSKYMGRWIEAKNRNR